MQDHLYYTELDFCQFSVHFVGPSWRYLIKRFLVWQDRSAFKQADITVLISVGHFHLVEIIEVFVDKYCINNLEEYFEDFPGKAFNVRFFKSFSPSF